MHMARGESIESMLNAVNSKFELPDVELMMSTMDQLQQALPSRRSEQGDFLKLRKKVKKNAQNIFFSFSKTYIALFFVLPVIMV